jgi:hypothetical protein
MAIWNISRKPSNRYPHGGVMKLTPDRIAMLSDGADALMGALLA